jgi:hypothetical protein
MNMRVHKAEGPRTFTDAQLCTMTADELNSAARHYRDDLRATWADLERAAVIWNAVKVSVRVHVAMRDGFPALLAEDA